MMKSMGSFKGFVVVALVSVSVLMLVGCPDQYVAKKDDTSQGKVEHQVPKRDLKPGDLIVDWETKREKLDTTALIENLKKNGVPGGGNNYEEIVMMTFYRKDGTSFVADIHGHEVEPCARVVDGRIESLGNKVCTGLTSDLSDKEKPKGLSILGIQKVTINTHRNPDCSVDFYCNYAVEGCR